MNAFPCRGCGYHFTLQELHGTDYCTDNCRLGMRWNHDGSVRSLPPGWKQEVRRRPGLTGTLITVRDERDRVVFQDREF